MRLFLFLTLFPLTLIAQAELKAIEHTDHWYTDYDSALAAAEKESNNVLVYFTGSDWCHPCKMLKKDFFDTETFKRMAPNYTLLYIDLPRNKTLLTPAQLKHNKELLTKLNKRSVFPLLKVLSSNGKELGEYAGYGMKGETKQHEALLERYKVAK